MRSPVRLGIPVFLLCGLCLRAFADRTVYVAITPTSVGFYGGSVDSQLYCDIWNPTTTSQSFTINSIAVAPFTNAGTKYIYNPPNVKNTMVNTSTAALAAIGPITLDKNNSFETYWSAGGSNATNFPKGLTITVAGDKGFLVGNCTYQVGGAANMLQTIPINGGQPF